jgi:hypothetical protein
LAVVGMLTTAVAARAEEKKSGAVDGTWTWKYKLRDGTEGEAKLVLKQEGEKVTGSYKARDGKETPIENGKVKGDEVTFDVNREVGDQKMLFKYSGKVSGDVITGKIVFGRDKPTPHEWEAKRVKEKA